ncbi:MAG: methyltransferase [Verrucomicrobiota bacterium]|nr:methyltransferase [Verrucomicrobiota bacterium]
MQEPQSSSWEKPQFKGWTKPGPKPPGLHSGEPRPEPGETLDAISGYFRIFQLAEGHRFSTDDVLTAWYGTSCCPRAERVLDLGSGIGSVGMIAAWRLPGSRFVTIEAQVESVRLARKSAAFNGLTDRYEIRQGDFRENALFQPNERFDLVLGSPPYFPLEAGIHGDHEQKIACRFEVRGTIHDYCSIAAQRLAPGGVFACIFPVRDGQMERVLSASKSADLAIVRKRPVALKEGEEPLLALFLMMSRNDLPGEMRDMTWMEPPLVIRRVDGSVHPEYQVIKLSFGFPP